jgi:hypothetical protein
MGIFLIGAETLRRGSEYWSIYATTIIEDYLAGSLLLLAAVCWTKRSVISARLMPAAWAYTLGMMSTAFIGHLEAWMRGVTIRPSHPHADLDAVVIKGIIWGISLACLLVSLWTKADQNSQKKV